LVDSAAQNVIYGRFELGNLSDLEQKQIKDVDDTLLHFEFEVLMEIHMFDPPPNKATEHDFSQRDFASVEKEFLAAFNRLTGADH